MKQTFNKLPIEKKQRVLNACIREFGEHGYDGSSMDRIIRAAEISKGGIYEYASSKEELFLGTVEYTSEWDLVSRLLRNRKFQLRRSRATVPDRFPPRGR